MASLKFAREAWELRYRDPPGEHRRESFQVRHGSGRRRAPGAKGRGRREPRHGPYSPGAARDPVRGVLPTLEGSRRIRDTHLYRSVTRPPPRPSVLAANWRPRDIRPSDVDDWIAGAFDRHGADLGATLLHPVPGARPTRGAGRDHRRPAGRIALPPKPKIRKSFDDVLSRQEVRRLVANVADHQPSYAGLKTNDRYRALILAGCGGARGGTRRSACGFVT